METCQHRMERIDAKKRIADFMVKEQLPYEFKVKYARVRVQEFVRECEMRDLRPLGSAFPTWRINPSRRYTGGSVWNACGPRCNT